ncbi:MAG: FAD binding domain-containing protein [Myxococcales bacterium]
MRFVLNGKPAQLGEVDPHLNLLTWLREAGFTGSKEGCAEGECGACAVALVEASMEPGAEPHDGHVSRLVPVNSCLLPIGAVVGRELVSVEGVADSDGRLHPVQEAMVQGGGSQCGYCTPGFVISLYCEYHRPERVGFDDECLSGNLCRCTGYRPMRDVARALAGTRPSDPRLPILDQTPPVAPRVDLVWSGAPSRAEAPARFLRPLELHEVFSALEAEPEARVIAGGTDLMVDVNQRDLRAPLWISLEGLSELMHLRSTATHFDLGAGRSLSSIEAWLQRAHPGELPLLEQLMPLFASPLIRNRATLGGSLVTASPIGDPAPVLLALDAELVLRSARGERHVPLSEFFQGYRRSALTPGELVASVRIPRSPSAGSRASVQRFYKVSKRITDDISTVAGAFLLERDDADRITRLRLAYAGIAATPLMAVQAQRAALGRPWDPATRAQVLEQLVALGSPIDDRRGSAAYRKAMITSLFERFCAEVDSLGSAP